MFDNVPKVDASRVAGADLSLESHPKLDVESSVPDQHFLKGYYKIIVINEGSNPYIRDAFKLYLFGVIQSSQCEKPKERLINGNTVLVLGANEELVSVELSECRKTFSRTKESSFGLWLDLTFRDRQSKVPNWRNILLVKYSGEQRVSHLN